MIWVLVLLPHSNFGLRIVDGVVVGAPPLADWALGLPASRVLSYYLSKDARFARVNLN